MRVAVGGGGATGALAAAVIGRRLAGRGAEVMVIDPSPTIGPGPAYSTPDPLRICIDVAENFSVIDVQGARSRRIKTLGALARATLWECIAVPEFTSSAVNLPRPWSMWARGSLGVGKSRAQTYVTISRVNQ